MAVKVRRLPQFGNNVLWKAKRQRKDANTASRELLSLRGGSSTPSSPLFTEEDEGDDQYVGFVQNQNFILALYLAAGMEIPEGMSPPQDRSMIRHGIRAWELLQAFLSEDDLNGVVKPVLLVPDNVNVVPSINTILRRVAVMCMRNGKPIFPWEEDIDEDYATWTLRVECSELMNYLTSILVWVVSNTPNELLYYRLGFERVYWRVKLYMFIWRSHTIECLMTRSSRPRRERESLYGESAQKHLKCEIEEADRNIRNITALREQLRDDGKTNLPRPTSRSHDPTTPLLPGERCAPREAYTFQDTDAGDKGSDKKRKHDETPSDRKFGGGTKCTRSPCAKAYDPFENIDVWQAYAGNIQVTEWKQFLRDLRAARRAVEEGETATPDKKKWEIYDPSQVDNLKQRCGEVQRFGRPEREFWPAPVQYTSLSGAIRYEL
ncbi:hypothetical protein PG984_008551 [Apiospora sp. TS-2023a]